MSDKLFGNLEVEAVNQENIRKIVSDRVKLLKKKIRIIPLQLSRYNQKLAEQLKSQWALENKEYRKIKKGEKPLERLDRWKDWAKRYRLLALNDMSKRWYSRFWKLRSDTALIVAMYEFSEVEKISIIKESLKSEIMNDITSISMRLKRPKKPTKKKILLKDIKYDIADAFLEMVKPLEIIAIEAKYKVDNLVAPRKKMPINVKIKRYQDVILAREYLTLLCQAVAPRQEAIIEEIHGINNET